MSKGLNMSKRLNGSGTRGLRGVRALRPPVARRLRLAAVAGLALALVAPLISVPASAQVGTKSIVTSVTSLKPSEGGSASTIMVRLGTQPTGTVTVALSASSGGNATDADCSGSGLTLCIDSDGVANTKTNTSLSFTTSTWEDYQSIEVSGLADADKLDESITLTLTPSGGGYGSTEAATVSITVRDDDKNTLVFTGLTSGGIEVDEGTSTSTFTVAMTANPDAAVTVAITSSNPAVSVSPTSLTFSTTTATTAQTVTITAGSDPNTDDEEYYLRLVPSGSADTRTRGYSVTVTVDDDGTSGLIVSETSLSLNESGSGNTDTFTVKLNANPAADKDVTVAIGVHGPDGKRVGTADKNKLTFTSTNGTTAQTVTITGVTDDDDANDTATVRVRATHDGPYSGLGHDISLTVTDTAAKPAITFTKNFQSIPERSTGTYSVALLSEPTSSVLVWLEKGDGAPLVGVPAQLTFTKDNYGTAQTMTVRASEISDSSVTSYVQFRASGGGYDGVRGELHPLQVTGAADATNEILVSLTPNGPPLHQVVVPGPGFVDVYVWLSHQPPSGSVVVQAAEDTDSRSPVPVGINFEDSGVFSNSEWNTPKRLRITLLEELDFTTTDDHPVIKLTGAGVGYFDKTRYFEVIEDDRTPVASEIAPTATIGDPNSNDVVTVTFSKAVGVCSTKTDTSAAERVCSGSVTAFTSSTVDDAFELVVGSSYDETLPEGTAVAFTATLSGNVATITPTVPTNAKALNLLVKDRYWSVDGGMIGPSVLKQLEVQNPEGADPPPMIGLKLFGLQLPNSSPPQPDFDGDSVTIQHLTTDSTACLDVKWGDAQDGQDVWTWDCNNTEAQKWTLEKRTAGAYAGYYRVVSQLSNDTYCLDNRGDFTTSDRMGIWSCVSDTHGAAANQSVTIAASGNGHTITFANGTNSVWLVTDRASDSPYGGANQTTVSGSAGTAAIWQIVTN